MYTIVDRIKQDITAKNLNITMLSKKLGVARKSVYNLSDDSIKLDTFLKLCKELKRDPIYFLSEEKKDSSTNIVNEPLQEYGNKDLELKMLKSRVKDLEKINMLLEERFELYKKGFEKNLQKG